MFKRFLVVLLAVSISIINVSCGNEDSKEQSLSDYLNSADYSKAYETATDNQKQEVYAENAVAYAVSRWLEMIKNNEEVFYTGLGYDHFPEGYMVKDISEGYYKNLDGIEFVYFHFNAQSNGETSGKHAVFTFTENETNQFIYLSEKKYNNGVERTADTESISTEEIKQFVEQSIQEGNQAILAINNIKNSGYKLSDESIERLNTLLSSDKLTNVVKLKAETNIDYSSDQSQEDHSPVQSQETSTLSESTLVLSSDSSLPKKVNYINYKGEIYNTMEVMDIMFGFNGNWLTIQVKAKLTYTSKGDNRTDTGWVGYRLLDSNNEVVSTGSINYSDLRVGDIMTKEEKIRLNTNEPKQYRLELVDED